MRVFRRLSRGVLYAFLAGIIASAVSVAIYRGLIVPRLPGWQQVPALWWALVFCPYLAAIVVLGHILESAWFALPNGLALTLGSAATTAVVSRLAASGGAPDAGDPAQFWAVLGGVIAGTLTATAGILLAWGTDGFFRRRRAAG
jgi:hypothetical protein